jgi:archaellum component FlaC
MSDTSETDDLARGNHVVPTEWAQQLERERDEAREEVKRLKIILDLIKKDTI